MNLTEREQEIAEIRRNMKRDAAPEGVGLTYGSSRIKDENIHTGNHHEHVERVASKPVWCRLLFPAELLVYNTVEQEYRRYPGDEGAWVFEPRGSYNYIHAQLLNGKYIVVNLTNGKISFVANRGEADSEIQFSK